MRNTFENPDDIESLFQCVEEAQFDMSRQTPEEIALRFVTFRKENPVFSYQPLKNNELSCPILESLIRRAVAAEQKGETRNISRRILEILFNKNNFEHFKDELAYLKTKPSQTEEGVFRLLSDTLDPSDLIHYQRKKITQLTMEFLCLELQLNLIRPQLTITSAENKCLRADIKSLQQQLAADKKNSQLATENTSAVAVETLTAINKKSTETIKRLQSQLAVCESQRDHLQFGNTALALALQQPFLNPVGFFAPPTLLPITNRQPVFQPFMDGYRPE